jgi:hypothetical protein
VAPGKEGQAGGGRKVAIRRQSFTGNPAYLEVVQWCIQEEVRLMGLHAAQPVDPLVQAEAERLADELGLSVEEVLREAESILREP